MGKKLHLVILFIFLCLSIPKASFALTPTPTTPPGCYYQIVECVRAPCNPVLFCPTSPYPTRIPTLSPKPTLTKTPTPTLTRTPTVTLTKVPSATPTKAPLVSVTAKPACLLQPRGDANCNGVVDSNDYVIWKAKYLSNQVTAPNNPDFNKDGKVTLVDLEIWTRYITTAH